MNAIESLAYPGSKQGKHRKQARVNANESGQMHSEADREKAKAKPNRRRPASTGEA